jgi:hypothetical protein
MNYVPDYLIFGIVSGLIIALASPEYLTPLMIGLSATFIRISLDERNKK